MTKELRIHVFTDRHGCATVSLAGDGVPHHRVPFHEAHRAVTTWIERARLSARDMRSERHRTLDDLVSLRARQLTARHGDFASPHEMYAVILEELCELFDEVRLREHKRSDVRLIRELVDIASAALRAANQLAGALDHTLTDAEVLNA